MKVHDLNLILGSSLGSRSHTIVRQYPPYHVAYVPAKFEVATSSGLGGYSFTRKYII